MSRRSALRKFLLLQQSSRAISAVQDAIAQQANNGQGAGPPRIYVPPGPLPVGGYSLRLSDVWGPAKMPPAPKDFGPHFRAAQRRPIH